MVRGIKLDPGYISDVTSGDLYTCSIGNSALPPVCRLVLFMSRRQLTTHWTGTHFRGCSSGRQRPNAVKYLAAGTLWPCGADTASPYGKANAVLGHGLYCRTCRLLFLTEGRYRDALVEETFLFSLVLEELLNSSRNRFKKKLTLLASGHRTRWQTTATATSCSPSRLVLRGYH